MTAVHTVGIVGAGTMGAGIAANLAQHGLAVRLVDQRPEAVAKAIADAATFFARNLEKGRMSAAQAETARAGLVDGGSLEGLAGCDLVIEAVFEDMAIKSALLTRLSAIVRADALVATNTSCLRVSDLARACARPERFLGLHYFSPAQVNPIVEVVRGQATSAATMAAGLALCRATAKRPIACKDSFGFAINRFFCPYTNEADRALDEGLGTTGQIDLVAREALGAAAGPFRVQNLVKPRINLHAIRNLAPLGAFYAPAEGLIRLGEADQSFAIEPAPAAIDPARHATIADRLRLGCFLPVLQALDEEVASPGDIDLGAREALRLARPPCALMDELGRAEVERILAPALARFALGRPRSLDRVGRLLG